jgi:hypothetical protein
MATAIEKIESKAELDGLKKMLEEQNPYSRVKVTPLMIVDKKLEVPMRMYSGGIYIGFYTADRILYEVKVD